ncbi:MAG: DUF116 domain-containing protein [Candidatus Auribacterota bacterium]|jgi:hypothetical protein|uniref:DUF116 domain-containing protein n=1 Tax=Candidatus Auribacter fodinae TaxID=2093366 RepID=A0A3A4R0Z2_9BACT|nr:MAG: DUF116 domain-containing protein [Candidatus Auribacter fodinae]
MKTTLIKLNNWQVKKRQVKAKPHEILVLCPRCLQNHTCAQDLISDVHNCKHCGKCQVTELVKLCDELGVNLKFATGGGMAVKLVRDPGVKAVVAIACEKELFMGLLTTIPKPVLAVKNLLPHGPCVNTGVSIQNVREALLELIE